MGSIAGHEARLQEHKEALDSAIAVGMKTRPATIGLHASAGSTELFELWLHKKSLISAGKTVKHDWFKRPKIGQKVMPLADRMLGAQFDGKEEIFELLYQIEDHRNTLVYGNPSPQR